MADTHLTRREEVYDGKVLLVPYAHQSYTLRSMREPVGDGRSAQYRRFKLFSFSAPGLEAHLRKVAQLRRNWRCLTIRPQRLARMGLPCRLRRNRATLRKRPQQATEAVLSFQGGQKNPRPLFQGFNCRYWASRLLGAVQGFFPPCPAAIFNPQPLATGETPISR